MSAMATALCSSATFPSEPEPEVKPIVATLDVYTTRRTEQGTRALNIRAVHLVGIANPQPVVRSNVKDNVAARKRLLNRRSVAQVADHPISVQIANVAQVACGPHQQPQVGSLFGQDACNMTAQKTRGAGDKS